jgi:predicted transcriptional regulator
MPKKITKGSDENRLLEEVIRIRKLLILQLVSQGLSPSAIGKGLGITTASQVRKLVPVKILKKKNKKGSQRED